MPISVGNCKCCEWGGGRKEEPGSGGKKEVNCEARARGWPQRHERGGLNKRHGSNRMLAWPGLAWPGPSTWAPQHGLQPHINMSDTTVHVTLPCM